MAMETSAPGSMAASTWASRCTINEKALFHAKHTCMYVCVYLVATMLIPRNDINGVSNGQKQFAFSTLRTFVDSMDGQALLQKHY